MFKRSFTALTLGFCLLCTGHVLAAQKTYVNGIDPNYPPHAYVGKSGMPEGFDVEAMDWIAQKMGFKVKHVPMDWDTIVASLLAQKIDMICSGMSITPERAKVISFSDPYFSVRKVLVVRGDSSLTPEQILGGGKKLGVQRATNEADWLEKNKQPNGWNYTLTYYSSAPLAIADLLNGRIDAAAIDSAPANNAMVKEKQPVKIAGEFAERDDFGVGLRKDDEELRKMINEGFRLLRQDPFWQQLQDKYNSHQ